MGCVCNDYFPTMARGTGDQARSNHWKGFWSENPIFSTQLRKNQQQQKADKRKDSEIGWRRVLERFLDYDTRRSLASRYVRLDGLTNQI